MPYDKYAVEHGSGWMVKLGRRSYLPVFRHTAVVSACNEDFRAVAIQRKRRSYFEVRRTALLAFNYNIAIKAIGELKRADRNLSYGKPVRALTSNTVGDLRDKLSVVLDSNREDSPSDVSKWQNADLARNKKTRFKRCITGANDMINSDADPSCVPFDARMLSARAYVIRRYRSGESRTAGTKSLSSIQLELHRRSVEKTCPSPTSASLTPIYPDNPEDFWWSSQTLDGTSHVTHALPAPVWRPFKGPIGGRPLSISQALHWGDDDHFVQTVSRAAPGYGAFVVHAAQPPSPDYRYPGAPFTVGNATVFPAVRFDQRSAPANCVYWSPPEPMMVHEVAAVEHGPLDRQPPDRRLYLRQAFVLPSMRITAPTDQSDSLASPEHCNASINHTTLRVDERATAEGCRAEACER